MATFVLVHGGGHGAWCWDRLAPLLTGQGHAVHTPVLTGVGERAGELTPAVNLSTHIADVCALIEREGLRDVILCGHSYGGMVITGIAGRLPGRIAELVFLDAPHPRDGESLADASPGMRPAIEPALRTVDGVQLCLFPDERSLAVYGLTDPADVAWAMAHLTPHPWACMIEPLRLEHPDAMRAIPRTSIDCRESAGRRAPEMNARAKAADRCLELDTGHDLMITAPDELAAMLGEIAAHPATPRPR